MFTDANLIPRDEAMECDLCIVGAGPAGLSLAKRFLDGPLRVVMLEGGGLDAASAASDLYETKSVGLPLPDTTTSRDRFFGGSTHRWHGLIAPLDPIDFEVRESVPHSGWPFTYPDLAPYYRRAHELCETGPYDYAVSAWTQPEQRVLDVDPARLRHRMWQHSRPARFNPMFRPWCSRSTHVQVLLEANAVELETGNGGSRIDSIRVATLKGNGFRVSARAYVLACGGIENPRLLLASQGGSAGGVANGNGMVGKYFAAHPRIDHAGALLLFADCAIPSVYDGFLSPNSPYPVTVNLSLSRMMQLERGLPNNVFRLHFPGANCVEDDGSFVTLDAPSDPLLPSVVALRVATSSQDPSLRKTIDLRAHPEPLPNSDSRVFLGERRDRLGLPEMVIDWKLTPADKRSLLHTLRRLGEVIGASGQGRLRLATWFDSPESDYWPPELFATWHHLGTTRMGVDPSTSVVDSNCRAHEVDNLYVAGSSVFPTYGWAPPTLTIIALALRLSDHLADLLEPTPVEFLDTSAS